MLAMKTLKKNRTVRQMLNDAGIEMPSQNLGMNLHMIQLLHERVEQELALMASAATSNTSVDWQQAQKAVASILTDLARISVLAAKAMGSFIDDVNKEIANE